MPPQSSTSKKKKNWPILFFPFSSHAVTQSVDFRIDIFTVAIDFQLQEFPKKKKLQELKSRFCEVTTKLVILSSALNLKDAFKLFKIVDICNLVKKYYLQDFIEHEQELLESQLQHY